VKISHKYYWNSAFPDPEVENTPVEIRYEPFNAGIAYAYVRGQWVQCISEYYTQFQGRSEKEIQLATAKLNQNQRNHAHNSKIRAKQLGQFLASVEAEEVLLQQRLQDEQLQEVFRVIDGGLPKFTANDNSEVIAPNTSPITHESEEIKPGQLRIFKSY
jgi:hypothetical protein